MDINANANQLHSGTKTLSELKGVTFASQNIHGLSSKVDEISVLLKRSKLDILALQETFLDANTDSVTVEIPGFTLHRADRDHNAFKKTGGRIGSIYLQ